MLVGWQPDDLPVFASVTSVIVIVGIVLLEIEVYFTEGINCHLSSYLLRPIHQNKVILLSSLDNKDVYYAHKFLGDKELYITMRSHVEKV